MGEEINHRKKFWEGSLLHKNPLTKEWRPLWAVIKGRVLYFFKERESLLNNLIGEIVLDLTVNVKPYRKDQLVFELIQRGSDKKNKKEQKFKCQSRTDRELWRAFIVGVAQGGVPKDLDWSSFLPGQRDDLIKFFRFIESGGLQSLGMSSDQVSNSSTGSAGSAAFNQEHDPTQPLQPKLQLSRQSWYFEHIDRDKGEQILSAGSKHGNLLLRPSVTRLGNFVLQFRATKQRGEAQFYNFLVEKIGSGYCLVINDSEVPHPVVEAAMMSKPSVFDIVSFFMLHVSRFLSCTEPILMKTNDMNSLSIWGEYGVPAVSRNPRHVRFDSTDTEEPASTTPSLSLVTSTSVVVTEDKSSHSETKLTRKSFSVPGDSDDENSVIPPPPLMPAPPPPPPKLTGEDNSLLPSSPPAAEMLAKVSAENSGEEKEEPQIQNLSQALKNIKLKSVSNCDSHSDTLTALDDVIGSTTKSSTTSNHGKPIDFQDELRMKLTKRFMHQSTD